MCGINGVFHFNNSRAVNEGEVIRMRETLKHRGPDSAGVFISQNKKVGFGHRRLAIIDLSPAGAQPMANEDGTVWIVFNGEIYNFHDLKPALLKKGHQFRSKSDTEVMIHAYEEYGFDCVKKFNGMFAFAIWDERKQLLFAARDHVGIKPFYYAIQNGTFYFGSEIKAILAHPDFKKELNEEGVSHYLTFGSAPAPFTLFKDIRKLPAAHCLLIRDGRTIEENEYWSPIASAQIQNSIRQLADKNQNELENYYVNEIRRVLRDSIKAQMVSDVPFGCFLSGGIDSSINATLMSESLGKPVETFSVGYKDFENKNEFQYSRMIAKKLGAQNHEIVLDESHLREFLPTYAYFADDPNSDPVCFPLFWLSKLAKEKNVIVIQIGEGADEIFAGYETYIRAVKLYKMWWSWLEKFPSAAKKMLLEKISEWEIHPRLYRNQEYIQRFARNEEPFWGIAIAFGGVEKNKLITAEFQRARMSTGYEIVEHYYNELKKIDATADFLKRITYLEIKHRLPEFLLARADKMTMAHSVEGRVPFLDTRLVELAFNMPSDIKIKGGRIKYILKKAVEGIIPQEIIDRKKQGFSNPIGEWLKPENPISQELTDIIFNSKIRERNILNYDYIKEVMYAHQHKNVDKHFKIWTLVTLSLWYDYWF